MQPITRDDLQCEFATEPGKEGFVAEFDSHGRLTSFGWKYANGQPGPHWFLKLDQDNMQASVSIREEYNSDDALDLDDWIKDWVDSITLRCGLEICAFCFRTKEEVSAMIEGDRALVCKDCIGEIVEMLEELDEADDEHQEDEE